MSKHEKAFPTLTRDPFDNYQSHGGMDLRDWFAGQAVSGMLRFTPRELKTWSELDEWAQSVCVAKVAYAIADAMIDARKLVSPSSKGRYSVVCDTYNSAGKKADRVVFSDCTKSEAERFMKSIPDYQNPRIIEE